MRPCTHCANHYHHSELSCPHCPNPRTTVLPVALGLLMGLGSVGCGEKSDTATSEPAVEEPTSEPDVQPEYGVPASQ